MNPENWVERLNRVAAGRIALGGALTVEVLYWAYNPHLPDNISHRHTYFEVCLVGAWGSGQFNVGPGTERAAHAIGPGHLFIARPGVLHQIVNTAGMSASLPMELFWVSFHAPVVSGTSKNPQGATANPTNALFDAFGRASDVLVVGPERASGVGAIWNALRVAASSGSGDITGQATALTVALLLAIAQAGGGERGAEFSESGDRLPETGSEASVPGDRLARQAVQYIHQHLSRPLLAREIADALVISPRHLTRIMRAYAGVGPQEYVDQARLDRARTLLLRTDDPIKQVAALSGYADVAHFTRAFARRFGCPPGAFRQSKGQADKTVRGGAMKTPGALV